MVGFVVKKSVSGIGTTQDLWWHAAQQYAAVFIYKWYDILLYCCVVRRALRTVHGKLAIAVAHSCSIVFRRRSDIPGLGVFVIDALGAVFLSAACHTSSMCRRFEREFKILQCCD